MPIEMFCLLGGLAVFIFGICTLDIAIREGFQRAFKPFIALTIITAVLYIWMTLARGIPVEHSSYYANITDVPTEKNLVIQVFPAKTQVKRIDSFVDSYVDVNKYMVQIT